MSFDHCRLFYVTKKDYLLSALVISIVSVLEIGFFIKRLIDLELNFVFLNILSLFGSSFSFIVSYVNFYLYKYTCINILQKIYKFDTEISYKPLHNYKLKRYIIFSVLTFISYISIDGLCIFLNFFPSEIVHIVIFAYISYFINFATRVVFIFFVTEIENRLIFISSYKNSKFHKHFKILIEISKSVSSIYNFPLILSAAKICISLTMSLQYVFLQLIVNIFEFTSFFLSLFWFCASTCEIGVIIFICQKFYNKVRIYHIFSII